MDQGRLAFTAVYLKSNHGYIGFIDEERREAEELIAGKEVVRESFLVPIPRPA